jgi:colicin import membrane protein
MSAGVYREEPERIISGVMAVVVHAIFFGMLVIGVSWQRRAPEVVNVDLWSQLPPLPKAKAPEPPPEPPKLEVKPPPPQPPVESPKPKIEAKPAPEPKPAVKPDIALEKEKLEKARREKEERELLEKKKRDEQVKAEARKKEDLEKQRLAAIDAERAAKDAERVRLEKEQAEAVQRLAQQQAAMLNKEIEGYKARIAEKIKRFVVKDPCAPLGNPEITFEVTLFPDGNTLGEPVIRRSSGSAACDQAVLRAVVRAQPLPLPKERELFNEFRNLNLRFKPNE